MSNIVANRRTLTGGTMLWAALKAEGYPLPEECASVEAVYPIDGVIQLRLTVNLTPEHLAAFGRAMIRIAERDFEPRKDPAHE